MKLRLFALPLLLIALVGCGGGGPSPDAIQESMQAQVRDAMRQAENIALSMGGSREMLRSMGQPTPEEVSIENVEILEKKALDNGDYRVSFTGEVVMGGQRRTRSLETVVKKTDKGWHVVMPN